MRLKVIGTCMAAMVTCTPIAQAQTATIGEVIQVVGDLTALQMICPKLSGKNENGLKYLEANGFTERMIGGAGIYSVDIEIAKKSSLDARKAMSVTDNCEDALKLYGENGTVVKGVLELKTAGAN